MKTFLMLFLAAFFPLASQQTAQNTPPVFRVSTSLAIVRFHVVKKSSYVDTVTAKDIVLLEDGKPRQIALFEGGKTKMRTSPVEVFILFDCSWGMKYYGRYDGLAISGSLFDDLPNVSLGVYGFQSGLKRFCSPAIRYRRAKRPDPGTQFGCIMLLGRGKSPEVYISHLIGSCGDHLQGGAPGGA